MYTVDQRYLNETPKTISATSAERDGAPNLTLHVIWRAITIWGNDNLDLFIHPKTPFITHNCPTRLPATSPSVDNNDSAHQKGKIGGGEGRGDILNFDLC